jgi:hypothetical protein
LARALLPTTRKHHGHLFSSSSPPQTHQNEWLLESAVNESITTNSIESATDKKAIAKFLEWKGYYHLLGYFIYGIDLASGKRLIQQFKPDAPHPFPEKEPAKYLTAKSRYDAILLDARNRLVPQDVSIPLHLTEGGKRQALYYSRIHGDRTVWCRDVAS